MTSPESLVASLSKELGTISEVDFEARLHGLDLATQHDTGWGERWALIHFAALNNRADLVEVLLRRGVEIDTPAGSATAIHEGAGPTTALHAALKRSHVECAGFLLDRGASVDARGTNTHTPLGQAAADPKVPVALLARLLERASPSTLDDPRLLAATAADSTEKTRLLLDAGCPMPADLWRVVMRWDVADLLLQRSVPVTDPEALVRIVSHDRRLDIDVVVATIQRMIAAGASVDSEIPRTGWTALAGAIYMEDDELALAILALGADPRKRIRVHYANGNDPLNETPREFAAANGRSRVAAAIEALEARDTTAKDAAAKAGKAKAGKA
ncbi:MAG: ankyrin repeat domain-containing protein [Deltaproteobacteria bacterium]|nr:ankyrin repeat domain-containing protein [Deltaproteobacteria bacterium]